MQLSALAAADAQCTRPRVRILIVENDVESWQLLERAVHEALPGALLQWASDAASARLALESCHFDAVLADDRLASDADGGEILAECRQLQPHARVGPTSALLRRPFALESCVDFMRRLLADAQREPAA
jgi:CheY-like chemotaxis protein